MKEYDITLSAWRWKFWTWLAHYHRCHGDVLKYRVLADAARSNGAIYSAERSRLMSQGLHYMVADIEAQASLWHAQSLWKFHRNVLHQNPGPYPTRETVTTVS